MKLSCNPCRNSLVTDSVPEQFSESYHLLKLKNNSGLNIPSAGTVKVIGAVEQCIRWTMNVASASHPCKLDTVDHVVRADIGGADILDLGQHIVDIQSGIDNHHYILISMIVSVFFT